MSTAHSGFSLKLIEPEVLNFVGLGSLFLLKGFSVLGSGTLKENAGAGPVLLESYELPKLNDFLNINAKGFSS